jgi:myo-inositol-1(or 4)-monophosphatase
MKGPPEFTLLQRKKALTEAVRAARAAGTLMRQNSLLTKQVNSSSRHDIKLELDVRCQLLIERHLRRSFPDVAVLGEEGTRGDIHAARRWVVDPIDGTVNFAYGIPHACVSIALQTVEPNPAFSPNHRNGRPTSSTAHTILGVVYDPFTDELWTALHGGPARLNGRIIHVSQRSRLQESIVSVGFAKHRRSLDQMLPLFHHLVHRVRKIRIMGSAALALTYVATGRLDAYLEEGVRLWDIAAGGLILECAGGEFYHVPIPGNHTYHVIANNGLLRSRLPKTLRSR